MYNLFMGKGKEQDLGEMIAAFTSKGWIVEDLDTGPDRHFYVAPSGHCFSEEQTSFSNCPICDDFDEDAICIHDEKDLVEGEEAIEFAKLIRIRDFRDIFGSPSRIL